MRRQSSLVTFASGLVVSFVIASPLPPQPVLAQVSETTRPEITSIGEAKEGRVFFTGSTYAVKDGNHGSVLVWTRDPATRNLQLAVDYCLTNAFLPDPNTKLTAVALRDQGQILAQTDQLLAATPTERRTLSKGYAPGLVWPSIACGGLGLWGRGYRFGWSGLGLGLGFAPRRHAIETECQAGFSRFDLTPQAAAIAQLPLRRLELQLIFSNGETSTLKLKQETVAALQKLLQVQ